MYSIRHGAGPRRQSGIAPAASARAFSRRAARELDAPALQRAPGVRGALALQRAAGNRTTRALLQRAVVPDTKFPMVRFTVGVEIASPLAALAWSRTADGPLDDAALAELRQLALQTDETIDDDEGTFIAALLDRRNAQVLHAMLPHGFTEAGQEISFPVQWISAANRRKVRDAGRSVAPPARSPRVPGRARARALDEAMVARAGAFGRPCARRSRWPTRPGWRTPTWTRR